MYDQVFNPAMPNSAGEWAGEVVANSATATAGISLPASCGEVALYNSSATALAVVRITPFPDSTPPADDASNAPTVALGMPVPPGQLIRIRVGPGNKMIRTIASAADGNIWIVPGNGG